MGLFSFFSKEKRKIESDKTINALIKWEQEHFPGKFSDYNKAARYNTYRTESGGAISLQYVKIPEPPKSTKEMVMAGIKNLLGYNEPDKGYLPHAIASYRDKIHVEIHRFQDNYLKLENLSENCKTDSLFDQIDHVFHTKFKILYHELLFCKFEKLGEFAYFSQLSGKLTRLYQDIKDLNTNFSDYMYALTNTEHDNIKRDLELIRAQVAAMSDAAEQYMEETDPQ